jgi:hypothetical protein
LSSRLAHHLGLTETLAPKIGVRVSFADALTRSAFSAVQGRSGEAVDLGHPGSGFGLGDVLVADQQSVEQRLVEQPPDVRCGLLVGDVGDPLARRLQASASSRSSLHLFYKGSVAEEVLAAEQDRIEAERAEARRWADAATHDAGEVTQTSERPGVLLDRLTDDLAAGGAWGERPHRSVRRLARHD